ncbi:MAG: hypothetical protein EOL92_00405 [Bacteroidia bacterium]|nr:hypothetical protein [Bacteroidia bacterium]
MAGTITTPDQSKKSVRQSPSYSYDCTLTFDAAGNIADVPIIGIDPGYLMAVDTIPDGDTPPDDNYTLLLLNGDGVDLLAGGGTSRSATTSQRLLGKPSPVRGDLYPTVALGGAGGIVRLILWMQGA